MFSFFGDFFLVIATIIMLLFLGLLIDASPCYTKAQSDLRLKFSGIVILVCAVIFMISLGFNNLENNVIAEIESTAYDVEEKTTVYDLVSLGDTSTFVNNLSTQNSYVNASISQEDSYVFFYKKDGAYEKGKILSSEVRIFEHDAIELDPNFVPQIIEYTTFHRYSPTEKQLKLISEKVLPKETSHVRYEIHVPKGTINTEFELDAK